MTFPSKQTTRNPPTTPMSSNCSESQPSELTQLLTLLTTSITTLTSAYTRMNLPLPNSHDPFDADREREALESSGVETWKEVVQAAGIISAAALQIEAIVSPPQVVLYHTVAGSFKSAAMRVCLESNVTEILRDAGSKGLHVNNIARINGQDPKKLARFLRYLCTNHIYREVTPNVFANNRISVLLDTGKDVKELFDRPEDKYKGTDGMAALVGHQLDETFKAAAYAWEALTDPDMVSSEEHIGTPLNKAFGLQEPYFKFLERPEQKMRRLRFDVAMQGMEKVVIGDVILSAFEWSKLPPGSVVVDVGGGVGTACFPLAEKFPGLKLFIQDLAGPVGNAKRIWSERLPGALESGQVKPEIHNFFDEQPHKNASVFFIKHVLHNWSDESCRKILKRLRDASGEQTRLVVMDSIMPYTCRTAKDPGCKSKSSSSEAEERLGTAVPGAIPIEAPSPLLANYGALTEMGHVLDMVMFCILNTQERTYDEMEELLRSSGWKIEVVRRQPVDASFVQIEASPAPY